MPGARPLFIIVTEVLPRVPRQSADKLFCCLVGLGVFDTATGNLRERKERRPRQQKCIRYDNSRRGT
jgi:hypothetical protein